MCHAVSRGLGRIGDIKQHCNIGLLDGIISYYMNSVQYHFNLV